MFNKLLFLPAVVLALGCIAGHPLPGVDQEVNVTRDKDLDDVTYTVSAGDCRIAWTVFGSEVNRGVVRHRSDCGLTLSGQASLIGRVLRKMMASDAHAAEFRTLSWGRLYPDGARDSTLALRLALAAKRSPEWDPLKGAPRGGDINGWVRELANQSMIYDELRGVFRQSRLDLRLSSVEKVLVLRAKLLPFYPQLRDAGIRPEDRVPFDCQAWFSVRPLAGSQR
jgi:hypothetical protein